MGILGNIKNIFTKFGEGTKSFTKTLEGILSSDLKPTTKIVKVRELEKAAKVQDKARILKKISEEKQKLNKEVKKYKTLNYSKKLEAEVKTQKNVKTVNEIKTYAFKESVKENVFANPFYDGSKYVQTKINLPGGDYKHITVRFKEIPDDRTFLDKMQRAVNKALSEYGIEGGKSFQVLEIFT